MKNLSASVAAPLKPWSRLNLAVEAERFGLVIALIVLFALFGVLQPGTFLSWGNISGMLGSQAVLAIVALALIVPLTSNDFDMSIANVLVLASVIVAVMNAQMGLSLWLAIPAALLSGLLVGAINGFFITYFRIHSLIVTIATGTFASGVATWMSGSQTISGVDFALMNYVIVKRLFGVPVVFYYAVLLALVLWYVFEHTAMGRRVLFVGRGREVSRLSGIDTDRVRWSALIASGFLGALAGILYCGTQGAADPSSGASFQLPAFAAAFLGSTAIQPGRFNAWGTLVAVYFLVIGITGLVFMGMSSFVQSLFYGGALLVAVVLSQWVRGRAEQQF
ncbi:ABC transporter permease [Lichenifustis flavocetrariae]|uniref:ABC transporter permease n=1 Tax=Lichenifustis flavocetrariae TaxID=2949735 RepID=A0AA41YXY3_9HYPH|nr:ABC transporter permease [Lichenifustis flavocetrariae]MCW6510179.1 ABC transporter permease [Lichenifustis flavocetrariae]